MARRRTILRVWAAATLVAALALLVPALAGADRASAHAGHHHAHAGHHHAAEPVSVQAETGHAQADVAVITLPQPPEPQSGCDDRGCCSSCGCYGCGAIASVIQTPARHGGSAALLARNQHARAGALQPTLQRPPNAL